MTDANAVLPTDPIHAPVSRRRAALWLLVMRYAALALVTARTLALVPLFYRYIGPEEYGAWFASGAVLIQLASTNFGFLGVLAQRVALAYGQKDREQLERLLGTGLATALLLTVFLAALSAALAPIFPWLYRIEGEMATRLALAFALTAVANGLQLFAFAVSSLLESFQRTAFSGLQQLVAELLSFACTAWLVLDGWGLYGIAWGLVLRAVWSATTNGLRCLWLFRHVFRLRLRWDGLLFRSLWRDSFHMFVLQLVIWARLYFDRPLIAAILGPSASAVYSFTMQAHETVRLLVLTLGGASLPGLAHLFGEGALARFKRVITLRYEIQAAAAAIGLGGVIAFNGAFMGLWLEQAAYAGQLVNVLAALATCAFIVTTVPHDGLWACGEFAVLSKRTFVEAVVRLSLMCLLLLTVGMAGAPAAALTTQTLILAVPLAVLLARRVGQPLGELARTGLGLARVGLPVFALSAVTLWVLPPAGDWLTLVVQACGFVAASLLLVAVLDPPLVRFVLRRGRDPIEAA